MGKKSFYIFKILKYYSLIIPVELIRNIIYQFIIIEQEFFHRYYRCQCLNIDCIINFWTTTYKVGDYDVIFHCHMKNCHNIIIKENDYHICGFCHEYICLKCFQNEEIVKYDGHCKKYCLNCPNCQDKNKEKCI